MPRIKDQNLKASNRPYYLVTDPWQLASAFAPYLLLSLPVLLAYSNIYQNEFLFDDEFLLVKNTFIRSFAHLIDIFHTSTTAGFGGTDPFFRPMQIFSYLVVTKFFGFSTVAFHALNLGIHLANACFVFALGLRLRISRAAAFCAALLWALHPVHTEAVTYMSATADTMHVCFILGGLLIWDEKKWQHQLAASGLFLCALLAKESAIVFPALAVTIIFFESAKSNKDPHCRESGSPPSLKGRWIPASAGMRKWKEWINPYLCTWPLWLLAFLYLGARATFLNFHDDFSFYKAPNEYTESIYLRVINFLATLPDYAVLLVAPHDLHMDRMAPGFLHASFFESKVLLGFAIALTALVAFIISLKRQPTAPYLAWGLLWFAAAYFPCTGIIMPVNALFLEHWMYLPSIGLFLGIAGGLQHTLAAKRVAPFAMTAVTVAGLVFAVLTFMQNEVWRAPIPFYLHILEFETGSARVHNNLAMAYDEAGQDELAIEHYLKSIATWDVYAQSHYNLALIYYRHGEVGMALEQLRQALKINHDFWQAKDFMDEIEKNRGNKSL